MSNNVKSDPKSRVFTACPPEMAQRRVKPRDGHETKRVLPTVRAPTTRRTAAVRVKDENATVPTSTAAHSRKPSATSAALAPGATARAKPSSVLAGGVKPVAGVKRSAFGDVSNKEKDVSGHKSSKEKEGSKPTTQRTTRSMVASQSASSGIVSRSARPALPKTNSSTGIAESTNSSRSSLATRPSSNAAPASVALSKPIIKVDSVPIEDVEASGSFEEALDDNEVDVVADRRSAAAKNFNELAQAAVIKSESDSEANEYTDEEQDVVDEDDWVRADEAKDEQARLEIEQLRQEFSDEVDVFDTTMVAEYADDIFAYMEELELKTMPNPRYMEFQTEIEWSMRTTLIDWLLQVHLRYHMLPETLWIAVNIIDRFLSVRVVSLVKLQLVGVTAMFIAAKYEEILAPSVDEFVYMTENGYSREEILKGERIILQTLNFNISSYCSPYSWVRRISKADDYDIQTRTLSKFLIEVTLLDYRFLRAKPSMIAAIGMYLANKMLNKKWNEAFVYYSNFTEAQLEQGANYLVENMAAADFDGQYVSKKYAHKKYLKASIFAREWSLNQIS
ncbi:cyclin-dependent protein kinase regulator [Phaffia rhodozyma]|uniref:Cyclin-dependent protein kinase regulator n=1 Tax=Phaffia rhodozyma TaxID=264483 RepID=A0A0F7SVN9_PHARH|nr:cyclin-dependent protein kinase regulator [Phaffia rhodozyma]